MLFSATIVLCHTFTPIAGQSQSQFPFFQLRIRQHTQPILGKLTNSSAREPDWPPISSFIKDA